MLIFFIYLLSIHYVADFICQTHWQASNKSKRNDALFMHVGTYSLVMLLAVIPFGALNQTISFGLFTFATHGLTDFCTSRVSAKLFGKNWHNFFVVIGLDQLIHQLTLAATMYYCFYN